MGLKFTIFNALLSPFVCVTTHNSNKSCKKEGHLHEYSVSPLQACNYWKSSRKLHMVEARTCHRGLGEIYKRQTNSKGSEAFHLSFITMWWGSNSAACLQKQWGWQRKIGLINSRLGLALQLVFWPTITPLNQTFRSQE